MTPGSEQTFEVAEPGDVSVFVVGPTDVLQVVVVQPSDGVAVDVTLVDSYGDSGGSRVR